MDGALILVSIVVVIISIAFLVRFFQLANDVADIRKKLDVMADRGVNPDHRKQIIKNKAVDYLIDWHRMRRSRDGSNVSNKISKAFEKDNDKFMKMISEYDAVDFYTIDELKSDLIKYFTK